MPTNNISVGKINKLKIFNGSEGLCCGVVEHNTSDSEMEAEWSSAAFILTYSMTYCHSRMASI
jgi:hypothetical protein